MPTCEFCKEEFEPFRVTQKTCGESCAKKLYALKKAAERRNEIPELECQGCHKKFKPKRFKSADINKWCSDACKMEVYKQEKRTKNASVHKETVLNCNHCKKDFYPRTRLDERFCCKRCKTDYHLAILRTKTAEERSLIVRTCPICQNDFTPSRTQKQIYCSRRCCYLLPKKMYKALQTCLEYTGGTKMDRTHKLLGYTPRQLQEHIQSHPNWPAVKDGSWHLDHIFPIIAFIQRGITDISLICSLDNLQPLAGEENVNKNDVYDLQKFEEWLDCRSAVK